MSDIKFTGEEKAILVDKLQRYFRRELNQDLGQFDAGFLLDFFSTDMGVYFYNRGLSDAQAMLEKKLDSISEAIDELEKPTDFMK